MLTIDGSHGDGGGQVLRTALALAMVTGEACRIENIRARRSRPGLLRQHLTACEAAAQVCGGDLRGAVPGAGTIEFRPGQVRPGAYEFDIGTAGSTTLVLQTLLPALLCAGAPSTLVLRGGTHNPLAPPYEFLAGAFAPLLARMGATVQLSLARAGFHPAGGGCLRAHIAPCAGLRPLVLLERGLVGAHVARAQVARLPRNIGERELGVVRAAALPGRADLAVEVISDTDGPGNALSLAIVSEHVTDVFTAFGARGVPAETVARRAVAEARRYLDAGVAVGEHLADQLLLPLALAGGGVFTTLPPSAHTRTQAATLGLFLDVAVTLEERAAGAWQVDVQRR